MVPARVPHKFWPVPLRKKLEFFDTRTLGRYAPVISSPTHFSYFVADHVQYADMKCKNDPSFLDILYKNIYKGKKFPK